MRLDDAELAHVPPQPPIECPACHGLFEGPVRLSDGTIIPGHIAGGPTCPARGGEKFVYVRDARHRKIVRRGR